MSFSPNWRRNQRCSRPQAAPSRAHAPCRRPQGGPLRLASLLLQRASSHCLGLPEAQLRSLNLGSLRGPSSVSLPTRQPTNSTEARNQGNAEVPRVCLPIVQRLRTFTSGYPGSRDAPSRRWVLVLAFGCYRQGLIPPLLLHLGGKQK